MYRAYCSECEWIADDLHADEDDAFADLDAHVQAEHAFAWGVSPEPDDSEPGGIETK